MYTDAFSYDIKTDYLSHFDIHLHIQKTIHIIIRKLI